MTPILFVLAGPTACGKTTVMEQLDRRGETNLHFVHATVTTRPPRPHEVDGVHFHFWSETKLDEYRRDGELLEYAVNHGYAYGTPKSFIPQDQDSFIIWDIGAGMRGKSHIKREVLIFLEPDDLDDLEHRLSLRGESEERIQVRLETARSEIARKAGADYIVPSREGELERQYQDVLAIVRAEQMRPMKANPLQSNDLLNGYGMALPLTRNELLIDRLYNSH